MYDTLTSKNYEDFRQRYQGSYGWLSVEGQPERIVYISKVSASKVMFNTITDRDFFAFVDQDVRFKFLPIRRGWYKGHTNRPVLLTRIPARQYCRGISAANTTCSTMSFDNRLLPCALSGELLEAIFNDAQQTIKYSRTEPCVLNKFFSFGSLRANPETGVSSRPVFFLEAKVATQTNNVVEFAKGWQHIKQEFSDSVRRAVLFNDIEVKE